jgi:hypothetical protein
MPTSYCVVGDIPAKVRNTLGRDDSVQEEIYRVAEMMDMKIGERYMLPLRLSSDNPRHVPYLNALKTFNVHGVTGHIVTRAAIGREDQDLIPYGRWHLKKLEEFLEAVCEGRVRFPDQEGVAVEGVEVVRGPIAFGPDGRSRVEPFYAGDNQKPWLGAVI